jgi:hypothetical protein
MSWSLGKTLGPPGTPKGPRWGPLEAQKRYSDTKCSVGIHTGHGSIGLLSVFSYIFYN